jgi:hypothetical protein
MADEAEHRAQIDAKLEELKTKLHAGRVASNASG